jgi:hypothetical protein
MDLSEVPTSPMMLAPSGAASDAEVSEDTALDLVAQLATEVASPLTSALERVNTLVNTGSIDRIGVAALRDELEAARRASIVGQQITRFASGRIRQSPECLSLTQMLRDCLIQRGPETQARGIQLRQVLKPAEVVVDASLLFGLLQAVLDWSLEHAKTNIDFRIDMKSWPVHARMTCHFGHRPADQAPNEQGRVVDAEPDLHYTRALDTLSWRLVDRIARTMGLTIERNDGSVDSTLTLEFPRTVAETVEGMTAVEIDDGMSTLSGYSRSMTGNNLLVIAARRDVRTQVRHALAHMGMVVDFVTSIDAAREFCRDGLPHAIVYESALAGEQFLELKGDLVAQAPDLAFVEITEQGQAFEVSCFGGSAVARVGREAILSSLPSALTFELCKGL